ncbi:MAG: hypothetical protein HY985_08175 [Magnetospirillum sp.]|nr:hypothetical protein [Magnetospirillum sp.]
MSTRKVARLLAGVAVVALGLMVADGAAAGLAKPTAQAVSVRGEGVTADQAIRAALRRAVEQAVGTRVAAVTAIDRFEVVRNEIVTHAEGYVRRYRVLNQGTTASGIAFAEIEAEVDDGEVADSLDAFPVLLATTGQPRVAVLGVDGGFDSVSAILPDSIALRDATADILRQRFHFATVDARELPRKGSGLRRSEAVAAAKGAGADYAVLVSVAAQGRGPGGQLTFEVVKPGEGTVLASDSESGALTRRGGRAGEVLAAVADKVFPLTVTAAHHIAGDLQQAAGSGGMRYHLGFADFPPEALAGIEKSLNTLPGFVRLDVEQRGARSADYVLWSHQQVGEVDESVRRLLADQHLQTRARLRGKSFRFDYLDPIFR